MEWICEGRVDNLSSELAREIERAGGFWCHACLVSHPATEQSPDPRYCLGCYQFLTREAEILKESGTRSRPKWLPVASSDTKRAGEKSLYTPTPIQQNLSTLKDEKSTVDIIRPRIGKRGPRRMELPDDEIKQLHKDGMGSKSIASWLKREHGINVSYKTIQRLLSVERPLALG